MITNTAVQPTETWDERIKREREENRKRYSDLYNGIAQHLARWHVEDTSDDMCDFRFRLVHADGKRKMSLNIGHNKKVIVSGYWPQRGETPNNGSWMSPRDVNEDSPAIGMSVTKDHATMARDIERRFLPEYSRIFSKLEEKRENENAYLNRKQLGWKTLVDSYLVSPRQHERDSDPTADVRIGTRGPDGWDYDKGYGYVRMTGEDSVEIHFSSLPVKTAMRILRAAQGKD